MFSVLPFSYMFMMVMVMGTLLSVSSFHWLSIWAGLEINLIGFLPLLVYQKSTSESESAVKYFIVQALGSSMLIFGSLIAFNMSFTWDLYTNSLSHSVGLLVILSGLCMKLGLFPFHYWLPSVMAGLPWITCLLLATWQKFAPLFLFLCLLELSESYMLVLSLCIISAGSSIVGGIGGMNQTQVRALLAYSSIGHLGWMTFALLHSEWSMKFYLLVYVLVSLFMFISLWGADLGTMKDISSLKNFSFVQMSVMLFLLSLGGLPPLLGFVSKWLVILVSSGNTFLSVLFVLILGSLMSLFYYLSLFFSVLLSNMKESNMGALMFETKQNNALALAVSFNLVGGVMIAFSNLFYIL
uniref:NADH-ubiquinone oxidoreductase chain 2 n=1 Tax=Reishia luteostoma TaxID=578820 RepID=A0A345WJ30_9CAEN|nr:NADH dehydrogenase subunit 2 [Reishia luteostoma]YP_010400242.1 NADH dehydrogenase subunit 2 [Reishia bronni]AXJ93073.1 NADH dehydrogenase subunit 2 [Reishia luteostoma]UQS75941.1 NADH dehydrogenase subunit 2 [Reishia bronni]